MDAFDWKLAMKINIFQLKLLGLWPKDNETYKFNLYSLYAVITLVFFIVGHNFFQTFNIYFIVDNLEAVTAVIFISITDLVAVLKAHFVVQNITILKHLMKTINCPIFQPRSLKQKAIIQPHIRLWRLVYWGYWTQASLSFFFWATFPIWDNSIKEHRLPFPAWYPYNAKLSPLYEITYLYQIISVYLIIGVNINVDMLVAGLNVYIASQCDLLCDNLKQFCSINQEGFNDSNNNLINCVYHHKEIIKFAKNSNIFFNWIVLSQFFSSAVAIGLTMFQLSLVAPFSTEFYSFIFYGTSMITEIFVYCWFGNEVEVKSTKIPNGAFEANWTSTSIEVKKNMYYFMIRTQKPIKLSSLNLFYLTVETFVRIVRTAWSYFAVLRQVNTY